MIRLIKKIIKNIIPSRIRYFLFTFKKKYREKKLAKIYGGKGVECLICNSEYRQFAHYGLKNRENAFCPKCGSLERHRLIWKYLSEKTNLFDREFKLLHFAPEESFYNHFVENPNIDYYPVDYSPELYHYSGKSKILFTDITKIPYRDNFFDIVLCNDVLEHIPDDRLAMSELYRVLKKETGWGIIQAPIDYSRDTTYEDFTITKPIEREKAFGQYDHVRWYGKDYIDRLSSVGFSVDEDKYLDLFTNDEILKYGFRKGDFIYKCNA